MSKSLQQLKRNRGSTINCEKLTSSRNQFVTKPLLGGHSLPTTPLGEVVPKRTKGPQLPEAPSARTRRSMRRTFWVRRRNCGSSGMGTNPSPSSRKLSRIPSWKRSPTYQVWPPDQIFPLFCFVFNFALFIFVMFPLFKKNHWFALRAN